VEGTNASLDAGNTYCQANSRAAFGYLRSRGVWQAGLTVAACQVPSVYDAHGFDLETQGAFQCDRQDHDAVFCTFTLPDDNMAVLEVHVFDPEPDALMQPEAAPIENLRHQKAGPVEVSK